MSESSKESRKGEQSTEEQDCDIDLAMKAVTALRLPPLCDQRSFKPFARVLLGLCRPLGLLPVLEGKILEDNLSFKQQLAATLIFSKVTTSIEDKSPAYDATMNARNLWEQWKALESRFCNPDVASTLDLFRRLLGARSDSHISFDSFAAVIESDVTDLKTYLTAHAIAELKTDTAPVGQVVSSVMDLLSVVVFLQGLLTGDQAQFDTIVPSLVAAKKVSLKEAVAQVRANLTIRQNAPESAGKTTGDTSAFKVDRFQGGSGPPRDSKCHRCGQMGHHKRSCKATIKKGDCKWHPTSTTHNTAACVRRDGGNKRHAANSASDSAADGDSTDATSFMVLANKHSNEFYGPVPIAMHARAGGRGERAVSVGPLIDGGANTPIESDPSVFTSLSYSDQPVAHLTTADKGKPHPVYASGQTKHLVATPSGPAPLSFRGVLHREGFQSIWPVCRLTAKGVAVAYVGSRCYAFRPASAAAWKPDGEVVFTGTQRPNGLYYADVVPSPRAQSFASPASVFLADATVPLDVRLLHARLGHRNVPTCVDIIRKGLVLSRVKFNLATVPKGLCPSCVQAKMHRLPHPAGPARAELRARRPLERVSTDIFHIAVSLCGNKFASIFHDDYTGHNTVVLMREKAQQLALYNDWERRAVVLHDQKPVKFLRHDNSGENRSNAALDHYSQQGTNEEPTCPGNSWQNGAAESNIRRIRESGRAMRLRANLPEEFEGAALVTAGVLSNINRINKQGKTPYEDWNKHKFDVSCLKVFGCDAWVFIPRHKRTKSSACAFLCRFIGYDLKRKCYRLYDPTRRQLRHRIILSKDVIFDEFSFTPLDDIRKGNFSPSARVKSLWEDVSRVRDLPRVPLPDTIDHSFSSDAQDPRPDDSDQGPDLSSDDDDLEAPGNVIDDHDSTPNSRVRPSYTQSPLDQPFVPQSSLSGLGEDADRKPPAPPSCPSFSDAVSDSSSATSPSTSPSLGAADSPPGSSLSSLSALPAPLPPQSPQLHNVFHSSVNVTGDTSQLACGVDALLAHAAITVEKGPQSMEDAMLQPDAHLYVQAREDEKNALLDNNAWEELDGPHQVPHGAQILPTMEVFTKKFHGNGSFDKVKDRLVVLGNHQRHEDRGETYAAVAAMTSFRLLLSIAATLGWSCRQIDFSAAFLNGVIDREVFIRLPKGFLRPGETTIVKLLKYLYGLAGAPHCWNKTLSDFLKSHGYQPCTADPCVFVKITDSYHLIMAVHVDDVKAISNSSSALDELVALLKTQFKVKDLGVGSSLLGTVTEHTPEGIKMSQPGYIRALLQQHDMEDCNPVKTPAVPGLDLGPPAASQDDLTSEEKDQLSKLPYASLVMSLLFLAVCTRPDIAVIVSNLSRFLSNYGLEHWQAAKRVLRYLKGTTNRGLLFPTSTVTDVRLRASCDASDGTDGTKFRARSGSFFYVAASGSPVMWNSLLQPVVSLCSNESEYISACRACQDLTWLRFLLEDVGFPQQDPTPLRIDNRGALILSKRPVLTRSSRHVLRKWHYVREVVEDKRVVLVKCPSSENESDLLTKLQTRVVFERHRDVVTYDCTSDTADG